MRHLLTLLLLTQSVALACLPPYRSPAMMSAERALNALRTGQACPNVVEDPCTRTYRAAPQEVARLLAQQANTVARRSGEVWTVVLDEYRGQRVEIRARAGGAVVSQTNIETAYETLLNRLAQAIDEVQENQSPATCAQTGLTNDRVLSFQNCSVIWERVNFPPPGRTKQPSLHFTVTQAADHTVELGRPFVYTPPTLDTPPCVGPLRYE
ncbi:hypothetical protein [Deinococcus arcticus]|uniref:Uncharacterized protein n=1 Tax=Deinococcus arcticus TaxID=2136176 RepID=A0A2T3W4I5_9DEIO|nr:hypothetical protein [Deinococcus arcticus]PTA66805.1 hypothetical protein C8263_15805 [Deinococcus arcticus]